MNNTKNIVVGMGEIGLPLFQLLSKFTPLEGYDKNPQLNRPNSKYLETEFLHVCVPFDDKFITNVLLLYKRYNPKGIVIHSTIIPGTTRKLQNKLPIPVIYSATRGIHKRMLYDLKRYTKFYAIEPDAPRAKWASSSYSKLMKKCGVKTKKMSNPLTLELAKIVTDTSYYGWLINYAQLSNMIAIKHKINYDEMWSFADEIHKFLGNRPKMFPGFIGGHCVIPNLDLISDETLNLIREINSDYTKILKKRHSRRGIIETTNEDSS
ncbi:MAG: GDP-mannose dehydrogenase [Nitrosopumilaceae archaeon]